MTINMKVVELESRFETFIDTGSCDAAKGAEQLTDGKVGDMPTETVPGRELELPTMVTSVFWVPLSVSTPPRATRRKKGMILVKC